MVLDPRSVGAFSEAESAKMRRIYLQAAAAWPASHGLTDSLKLKLASIIVYICTSEKQTGTLHVSDERELATEAVEVLLEMPDRRSWPKAFNVA